MTTTALEIPSLKGKVSDEEWAVARRPGRRLPAGGALRLGGPRLHAHLGRACPGTEDQFLINPYGLFFDEITASSLVKIDQDGQQGRATRRSTSTRPASSSTARSTRARHDAKCVLHTHTANGVAVSAQRAGLLPISQHSHLRAQQLGYHDYEGPALDADEKPRLQADLGDNAS